MTFCQQFTVTILLAVVILWVKGVDIAPVAHEENDVLEHSLVLREDLSGFAGISVKVITLEPDGSWLEEHYLITEPGKELENQKRTKHEGGKLSHDELEEVRARLKAVQFQTLTGETEDNENIGYGGERITISYGTHEVSRFRSATKETVEATNDQLLELANSIMSAVAKEADERDD